MQNQKSFSIESCCCDHNGKIIYTFNNEQDLKRVDANIRITPNGGTESHANIEFQDTRNILEEIQNQLLILSQKIQDEEHK